MGKFKNKIIKGKIKQYRLLDSLGSGGNGVVQRAEENGNFFAIKFLKEEMESKKKIQRFKQEVKFLTEHKHDNIVRIIDSGEFEGMLFYVMPVYNKTLRNVIDEDNSIVKIFDYILQMCNGIKFIHSVNAIHRDIKPENILFDNDKIVIADLGIAHFEDSNITEKSELLANRSYAAPEQKKKGFSKQITKSVDIYALGCIINELFTKENPSGTNFIKVVDRFPWLNRIDDLVDRCMRQNPMERPGIEEVELEIQLLKGEIEENIQGIKDLLYIDYEFEGIDVNLADLNEWIDTGAEDILIAKYIFENVSEDEIEKYNYNYNCRIHYKIDDELQAKYFNELLKQECESKFNSEGYSYAKNLTYKSLDLNLEDDRKMYDQFFRILNQKGEIDGKILKLFASCCDYHCEEILNKVSSIEGKVDDLLDAPILYIVKKLKNVISEDIKIEEHLLINWKQTQNDNSLLEIQSLYLNCVADDEMRILDSFRDRYDVVYRKRKEKYSVIFKNAEKYYQFKNDAISLSKPYYIFAGDVLDIIRIKREYNGIIELNELDSFDVKNVLAKILGLRTDY